MNDTMSSRTEAHPILGLGHVGLYVFDLAESVRFWTGLLGFQVTDGSVESGFCFLSTRPEEEHHMMLLRGGRTASRDTLLVQQVSFRVTSLEAVSGYSRTLRAAGVATMDVSHGNAVGVYFRDPDGNRCEVYWQTGLTAHQIYKQAVDLSLPPDRVMEGIGAHVRDHAETGYNEDTPFLLDYPSQASSA